MFSIVASLIYIPICSVLETSPFSTSLPALVTVCLFDNSCSDRGKVIAHCGFEKWEIFRAVVLVGGSGHPRESQTANCLHDSNDDTCPFHCHYMNVHESSPQAVCAV